MAAARPTAETAIPGPGRFTATTAGTVLAGVAFDPPSAWTDLGPSGMRQAQYRLPAVAGDAPRPR